MNTSYAVAKELDFYRIRETVAELAVSEEGKQSLLAREPVSDKTQIEYLKSLGREWNTYISSNNQSALSAWPPVESYFKLLGKEGAQLEQDQIFAGKIKEKHNDSTGKHKHSKSCKRNFNTARHFPSTARNFCSNRN